MKIYSVIIMSITLGIFYSLAVHQQKNWKAKELKTFTPEKQMEDFGTASGIVPYLMIEDEFSMQVTGKEHRYLNTGMSYIEAPKVIEENNCVAEHLEKSNPDLSGT